MPANSPYPWESCGFRNFDLGRLYRSAYRKRQDLALYYPWVPVTPSRIGGYCRGDGPYPAGAMERLWNGWSHLRGRCPECRRRIVGISFGGLLSTGHITGVCTGCSTMFTRWIGGIGRIMAAIRPILSGTPFGPAGRAAKPDDLPVALVAVLQELGESGLPDPRSLGFLPRLPLQKGDVGTPGT